MHWQQQQQQQQGQQPNANGDWSGQPAWQSTNGGWAQAPPGGGYAQPAYGQPAYGQSAYGQQQEARAPDRGAGAGYAGGGGQLPGGTSAPYGQTQVPMPQPGAYGAPPVQLNAAAMQGMQGVAANLAMNYGEEMAGKLQSNISRWLPIESLRYYFQLNNAFVLSKLKILLLPFRHRSWSRALSGSGGFAEPRHDTNAPDLYLPTMAFVTYVLLIAYHLGQQGRFTPEIFSMAASRGLGVVLLEVVFMKAAFYFFPASALPSGSGGSGAALLDLVAYSGYKFVGVVLSSLVGLFAPAAVSHLVTIYVALCTGFFILKTLTEVRGSATLTPEVMKQNYCIFGLAGVQFVFAWYLAAT